MGTLSLKRGSESWVHMAEIEAFTIDTGDQKLQLSNPRWASFDADQPNGEGASVASWDGFDVSKATDGVLDFDPLIDHGAHPAVAANFFVDLTQPSVVSTIKIWPRLNGGGKNYDGITVYAGSYLCESKEVYSTAFVESTIIPNQEPLIFNCPFDRNSSSFVSTVSIRQGSYQDELVHLAEIEVFTHTQLCNSAIHVSLPFDTVVSIERKSEINAENPSHNFLDIFGSDFNPGNTLILFSYHEGNNQIFKFVQEKSNVVDSYTIRSAVKDNVVVAVDESTGSLRVGEYDGGINQLWSFTFGGVDDDGENYFYLIPQISLTDSTQKFQPLTNSMKIRVNEISTTIS